MVKANRHLLRRNRGIGFPQTADYYGVFLMAVLFQTACLFKARKTGN
jgi:hypothetical protein